MDDMGVRSRRVSVDTAGPRRSAAKPLRVALVAASVFVATTNCTLGDRFEAIASGGTSGTSHIGKDVSSDPPIDALGGTGGEDGSGRDGTATGGGPTGGNTGTSTGSGGSVAGSGGAGSATDDGGDVGAGGIGGRGGSGGHGGEGGKGGAAGTTPPDGSSGSSSADGSVGGGGTAGSSGSAGAGSGTGGSGSGAGGSSGTAGTAGSGGASGGAGTSGAGGGGTGGAPIDASTDVVPTTPMFIVGSFGKSGTVGTQVVTHALGNVPKAVLLWTTGKTNETPSSGFYFGIGVSDGGTSLSMSASVQDAASPSTSGRRMAEKALCVSSFDETVIAEADMASWNSTNFVLNWTTNSSEPYVIHYLAIGAPSVTAKVVAWQAPTSPGTKVVNVGFQPDAVIHFHLGAAFTTPPPSSNGNAVFGIGAMDSSGAEWALMEGDSSSISPTTNSRAQKTDSVVYMSTDSSGATLLKEATFASMDSSGFSLNFTSQSTSAQASQIFSLALAGVKAKAGFFVKSTASTPALQSITAPGFRPGAVLLASYQGAAQTAAVHASQLRYGLGISDGSHEASSAIAAASGVTTSNANGVDNTSKAFMKVDNANMSIDAEADLVSLDANGFTLNWTKNDAIATQICFLALGAP